MPSRICSNFRRTCAGENGFGKNASTPKAAIRSGVAGSVSALTTIVLIWVTRLALREKYYSAVMAATGLLYLAILTAFGTDLIARAVLS